MKQFDLPRLIQIHARLDFGCATLKDSGAAFQNSDAPLWIDFLADIHDYCETVGFNHASAKAFAIRLDLQTFPGKFTGTVLAAHLGGLKEDLNICMFSHRFIQIEGGAQKYLESGTIFGESVKTSFPNAAADIQSAGYCIAVDLNTAAVFHLMHVVEWGLRALAIDVGLADIVTDKSKGKTTPVEFAQWEQILNQIPEKIEAIILAMPRGDEKQKAQEFYYSAVGEIRGFKDAWRNHVMHTRRSYTNADALAVFSHVQRFMQNLAGYGISGDTLE